MEESKRERAGWEQRVIERNKHLLRSKEDDWEVYKNQMQDSIRELQAEKDQLEGQLLQLNQKAISDKLQNENQIKNLQLKGAQLTGHNEELLSENARLQEAVRATEEQLTDQQLEFSKAKATLENNFKMMKQKMADQSAKIHDFQLEIEKLLLDAHDKEEQYHKLCEQFTAEKNQLNDHITHIELKLKQHKDNYDSLLKQYNEAQDQIKELKKEKKDLQAELDDLN